MLQRPLIISSLMAAVFLMLQTVDLNFLFVLIIALLAYGLAIGVLGAYALGGHQVLWAKLTARR
jgi:hypothetical protein